MWLLLSVTGSIKWLLLSVTGNNKVGFVLLVLTDNMYKCVALKQFQRKQQEGATHTKTKLFTYLYTKKENNHYSDYYSKISRGIVIIQLVCVIYSFITFIDDIKPLRKPWNSRDNPANIFSIMESVGNYSVYKQRASVFILMFRRGNIVQS